MSVFVECIEQLLIAALKRREECLFAGPIRSRRETSAAEANGSGPAGTWTRTVDAVGWRILGPSRRRGALIDVAYLSPGTIEARGGIVTRDHDPRENNLWCDEPFQPVRYHWRADADRLTLTLAGPRRCGAQLRVWAAVWTRG